MDERELEARISARLHARFDGALPSAALRAAVQDVPTPAVRALPRSMSLAWLAAAALVVAIAVGLGIRGWTGSSGPGAVPTVSPEAFSLQYIVLPPDGSTPSKAETSIASDVLMLRIQTIAAAQFGSAGFTVGSAAGDAITLEVRSDVDDATLRAVLSATGEISFVPLPPEDYGAGKAEPVIGEPLPAEEAALFGLEQIESSGVGTKDGVPASVYFDLKPIGTAALEVYTSGHVGEQFAVLIDGRVALLSTVLGPISDGRLELTGPGPWSIAVLAAIVASGTLPEAWREPQVPVVIAEGEARSLALAGHAAGATVVSAELTTLRAPVTGRGLTAIWAVRLEGSFQACEAQTMSPVVSEPSCGAADTALVYLDAVTGADLGGQVLAP